MEKYEVLNKALAPLDTVMTAAFDAMKKANVYEPFKNAMFQTIRAAMQTNFKMSHKVKVIGAENVPQEGGVILAVNHQSWLDAQLLAAMSPRKARFIAKAMFEDWPILRQTIDLADGIFIRRGGDEDGLKKVADILRGGDCVAIFPEGTIPGEEDVSRWELDPETGLLKGKTGAVRLAIMGGVPIVPVGLSGPGQAFPPEAYPRLQQLPLTRSVPLEVRFGEPITYGNRNIKDVTYDELRSLTNDLMRAISRLVDPSMAYKPFQLPIPVKNAPTTLPPTPYRNKPVKEKRPLGVLIVHGFTSHVSCVADLRFPVQEAGLPYRIPILRGHGGEWKDLKGVKASDWFEDAENSMLDLLTECEKVVLVGHSMGGLVCLELAARHRNKVAGLVTLAAALKFKDPLSFLTPAMAAVVPSWPSPNAYQDEELGKQRNKNYPKFPTDAFAELYAYSKYIENNLSFVHAPTLVLHSHKDQVIAPKAAQVIYKTISSKDKKLTWFEESGHEMMLDLEAEKIIATVGDFIRDLASRS